MPFELVPIGSGYKVCDNSVGVIAAKHRRCLDLDAEGKCYSKKPISKKQATKQRIAIAMSEHRATGRPIKSYFV